MKLINKEEFKTLSANEKRIAICKDVLERIGLGLLKPNQGQFWRNSPFTNSVTPQDYINKNRCEVCAKGGLMCAWVGNFNKVGWEKVKNFSEGLNSERSFPPALKKTVRAENA